MTKAWWIIACALTVLAIAGTAAIYPSLPEKIPIHWNAHGEIDGWGAKPWSFLSPAIMVGMLGLLSVIPWLSPKQFEVDTFRGTYAFIVALVIALIGFIHVLTLLPPLNIPVRIEKVMICGMMVFFMLMGNVLGKVQRNFFVGVRTPWTLASERVWLETHRLAARVFVGVGILGIITTLLGLSILLPIGLIIAGVVVIVGFSLVRYKQLERRGQL
ncbi:MAG: SdpI family protein [Planctomycetia bacterium]|nr:SdpI family protein [Planctomycetia bacterium]